MTATGAEPMRAPTNNHMKAILDPTKRNRGDILLPKGKIGGKTLVPFGDTLKGRWMIKGLIGRGGYGEIYYALDNLGQDEVAVKVEPQVRKGKTVKRMILEQKVLLRLQGRAHVPKLLASGTEGKLNFIVMQMLSANVGDLRKESPTKTLSHSTVARTMQQAIGALRDLHNVGYVHRDIKPANMCFGINPDARHRMFLLDFGLVRKFHRVDGTLRVPRERVGFRGTVRYVSVRVHDRKEQGPSDDMVSLFYSAIELLVGELPWKSIKSPIEMRARKEALQRSQCVDLAPQIGESFRDTMSMVWALDGFQIPDYAALQNMLEPARGGKQLDDPYDWDEDFVNVPRKSNT